MRRSTHKTPPHLSTSTDKGWNPSVEGFAVPGEPRELAVQNKPRVGNEYAEDGEILREGEEPVKIEVAQGFVREPCGWDAKRYHCGKGEDGRAEVQGRLHRPGHDCAVPRQVFAPLGDQVEATVVEGCEEQGVFVGVLQSEYPGGRHDHEGAELMTHGAFRVFDFS